jgi:hypothetical protein
MLNDEPLPTNKPQPMRTTDWLLLGILIVMLLSSLPFLWFIYRPLLWIFFRFALPVGIVVFIGYFGLRALKLGEIRGNGPDNDEFREKLHHFWIDFSALVRKSFRKVALAVILVTVVFVACAIGYTRYSRKGLTEKQLARMSQSLEKYKAHYGVYPNGLAELIGTDPLKREWYHDAWGNKVEYSLTNNGLAYTLKSAGADGVVGNEDDLIK